MKLKKKQIISKVVNLDLSSIILILFLWTVNLILSWKIYSMNKIDLGIFKQLN